VGVRVACQWRQAEFRRPRCGSGPGIVGFIVGIMVGFDITQLYRAARARWPALLLGSAAGFAGRESTSVAPGRSLLSGACNEATVAETSCSMASAISPPSASPRDSLVTRSGLTRV